MERERFSLLLLEPGEIYFEDHSVYFYTADQYHDKAGTETEMLGRLKVCSKSLVFEPKNITKPILKMKFEYCKSIEKIKVSEKDKLTSLAKHDKAICVSCTRHVEMLEGNTITPYVFRDMRVEFVFVLNYGDIEYFLRQTGPLHRAASLAPKEQNYMLQTIEAAIQASKTFNRLWLQDMYEQVVLETTAKKITPLVVNPGIVLLSNTTLYFQSYNNIESNNVLIINLSDILRITKRRFMLQHVGCEVEYSSQSGEQRLFLSFTQSIKRDEFYTRVTAQPCLHLAETGRERMLLCWQNGILSNYDYLLYLNSEADRTFNDLTQYPVFPWVIQDYESSTLNLYSSQTFRDLTKPVGALNPTKLQRLKERYEEMIGDKFLYGSHYSAPGFVLFYLVRLYPHLVLCMNNGSFDKPDRMFNSVAGAWGNVLINNADFKELIPEFYDVNNNGDFLSNQYGINFGFRSDNTKVGDVKLPPWAEGPEDFVRKMREALESDYVSRNLHHWIDLIFGFKQTGEEAVKADNLFCSTCYEGAIDLDSITDWSERHSLEVQIMEFGQIPKQIFLQPHPKRITSRVDRPISHSSSTDNISAWQLSPVLPCVSSHKDAVTAVTLSADFQQVVSVGRDGLLKIHTVATGRQERSAVLSVTPLSSLVAFLPSTVVVGSWDSNIIQYDVACGRVADSMLGHEDAVTCVCWASARQLLITGSWDCCVRLWRVEDPPTAPIRPATDLITQLDHDSRVTCLDVNKRNTELVSGTEDGDVFVWSLSSYSILHQLSVHSGAVNGVKFSPDAKKLVSCSDDRTFKLFDFSCGGMQTFCKELDEQLKCLAWNGSVLLLGGGMGSVYIWDMIQVTLKKHIRAHQGAVLCMVMADNETVLLTGGEDSKLIVWRPET